MMSGFRQDLAYAFSNSLRSPLFTLLAILSLALGIGANTSIFSVIHAVLLRPLDYPQPDRLIRLWETFEHSSGRGWGSVSTPNLFDWREQNSLFDELAAYSMNTYNLTDGNRPVLVRGARVEPGIGRVLQAEPQMGRFFNAGENQAGADQVVVISHGLWQRQFAGDQDIVGKEVGIDSSRYTVIGVMPTSFQLPPRSHAELWTPLTFTEGNLNSRGNHWMSVLGRLKPEVGLERALSEMNTIARRLEEAYPGPQDKRGITILTLHDSLVSRSRDALWTLWGAVALVLLIGCANVANLLLARAVGRRRELAVRAALGASRGRIVRQMLTESSLLALVGGAAGLVLSLWAVRTLASLPGTSIPQGQPIQVNLSVLAFCLLASLATAVIAGLVPALRSSKLDVAESLKERSSSEVAGSSRDWLRGGLVVAEIALAIVVLVSAGLLIRSYSRLLEVDSGIDSERVLTMTVPLPRSKYSQSDQIISFYQRLEERIKALPGVEAAGMINLLPVRNWGWNSSIVIEGMPELPPSQRPLSETRTIAGDYFSSLGIPLLAGRMFGSGQGEPPNVILVNKAFADKFMQGENPIGRRVAWDTPDSDEGWMTIVGMVGNVRSAGLERQHLAEMYFPLLQRPMSRMSLTLRTALEPTGIAEMLRREVQQIDPEQPVFEVQVMDGVISDSVAGRRFKVLLMGIFASVALVLAIAGVYGVLSYAVGRRSYEIAVRQALGASRGDVYRLIIAGSLGLSGMGIALGLAASIWLTRFLESQLYGVEPTDPVTLASVCGVLLLVSMLAAFLPARRATRVDPLTALRTE